MMRAAHSPDIDELIHHLNRAVALGDVSRITETIKQNLEEFSGPWADRLPERFQECRGDRYARRLLHRSEELGYTIVVMTWGPNQGTELHDHAGIWCVECVLDGELEVTQYDLMEREGARHRFEKRTSVRAGVGSAGCLIPPFEYHTLSNPQGDRKTITLHVYGGEMDRCNLYRPDGSGWWDRVPKALEYAS